ncbi:MAG: trypsin-like peptidase domain-containing protein [Bacteroidota bacterium]
MKKIKLVVLSILFACTLASAQTKTKLFYDKDWKVTESENNAAFYRIYYSDNQNKNIFTVTDYFISGEKQWEGKMSYLDKKDNSKDIAEGHCTWYYKSGKVQRTSFMVKNKEDSVTNSYYENGNKMSESHFLNTELNGTSQEWYESGKTKFKAEFAKGVLVNSKFTQCDEADRCQEVFIDDFKKNNNKWPVGKYSSYESKVDEKKGLVIKSKTISSNSQLINLELPNEKNFTIETVIKFNGGDIASAHGVIFGFEDWNNYYAVQITANGFYRFEKTENGINKATQGWTYTPYIQKNKKANYIKISKVYDEIYVVINNNPIGVIEFDELKGKKLGYVFAGKKEIMINTLVVKTDDGDFYGKMKPPTKKDKIWKGNGTGFFVSNEGHIVTNYHVVEYAKEIEIEILVGETQKIYKAKVLSTDKQNDLAVVKIEDENFVPFTSIPFTIKTDISDVGTNVFALGYPMALNVMGMEVKFTDGKISSKTGAQGDIATYQTSVPVQPGNSGGPLFDYDGNLIGVINSKIMAADNVSYAIKANFIKNLLDVLPTPVKMPDGKELTNKTLTEKIKILSNFVPIIKIK